MNIYQICLIRYIFNFPPWNNCWEKRNEITQKRCQNDASVYMEEGDSFKGMKETANQDGMMRLSQTQFFLVDWRLCPPWKTRLQGYN